MEIYEREEKVEPTAESVLMSPQKLNKLSSKVQAIANTDIQEALDEFLYHDGAKETQIKKKEQASTMKNTLIANYASR